MLDGRKGGAYLIGNGGGGVVSDLTQRVSDYMTPAPVCISVDADLEAAAATMQEHGIRHLPVMDGDALVGVVSERDLAMVESLVPEEWRQISVAEAMTPHPYAVPPDAPLCDVAKHMAQEKLGCAVITKPQGQVIGLFTTTDALRVLAQLTDRKVPPGQ